MTRETAIEKAKEYWMKVNPYFNGTYDDYLMSMNYHAEQMADFHLVMMDEAELIWKKKYEELWKRYYDSIPEEE